MENGGKSHGVFLMNSNAMGKFKCFSLAMNYLIDIGFFCALEITLIAEASEFELILSSTQVQQQQRETVHVKTF